MTNPKPARTRTSQVAPKTKTHGHSTQKFKSLIKGVSKDILEHPLVASKGNNTADNCPVPWITDVAGLIKAFAVPDTARGTLPLTDYLALSMKDPIQKKKRNSEKDGVYIILGRFNSPKTRKTEDIVSLCGFMVDLDQGNYTKEHIKQVMDGTFCIVYSTYSSHPADRRWRILIPYAAPIAPKDHHKVYDHFNELFEGNLDGCCNKVGQLWFTPACPLDAAHLYEIVVVSGGLLDVSSVPVIQKTTKSKPHLPAQPNVMTVEVERVRSALKTIPADDRDLWVTLGIALKQQMPVEVGYELWIEWSQKSYKFDPDDAERTWNSFGEDYGGEPVTLGSVFFHAKSNGWVDTFTPMHPAAEELNKTHFAAFMGGKNLIFEEAYDLELKRQILRLYPLRDFREHHANKRVRIEVDNKLKEEAVVDLWYQHPSRRTYNNVVFMPGLKAPPDVYNSWRGFAVSPVPGDWSLLKQHMLDNVCVGDQGCFDYLMNWMAFAVQYPHLRPGVAVVMQGAQGTGKGKLATTFMKLFGTHAMQVTQTSHLTGKFNYHLRDCMLLFVDEALWAGDKAGENVLKGLVTEEHIQVEKKFSDVTTVTNRLHIMMASNNDWVVPAGANERRYFVLRVGESQMQNHAYFAAIDEQMDKRGGLEALMHELLLVDLNGFNVRNFPKTAALDQQKLHSLGPDHLWWLDHLGKGDPSNWQFQARNVLSESFAAHGGVYNQRSSETRLALFLKKVVPGGVKKVNAQGSSYGGPVPCYEFPDLVTCKAAFVSFHGLKDDPWV